MSDDVNGSVSYTVKELLARQDAKLDTILLTLANKADKAETERTIGKLEQRLEAAEGMAEAAQQELHSFRRAAKIIGSLAIGAATVVGVFVERGGL